MNRLEPMPPSVLEPEARRLYDAITEGPRASGPQHFALTRHDGSLTGPFNAFLLNPVLGHALQALGAALRYGGSLSARSREIAILTVAAARDSTFERESHEAVGRASGLSEDEIESLRAGNVPDLADRHEAACARLAHAMTRGDVSDLVWDEDGELVGAPAVFELATIVGHYSTLALQMRVFGVD